MPRHLRLGRKRRDQEEVRIKERRGPVLIGSAGASNGSERGKRE